MSYTIGTSALKNGPSQDPSYDPQGLGSRSTPTGVDSAAHAIPSFSLLEMNSADRKRRLLVLGFSPIFEGVAIVLALLALMAMPHQPAVKFVRQEVLRFNLATPPPAVKHVPQFVKQPPMADLRSAPVIPRVHQTEIAKPELSHLTAPKIAEPRIELPKPAPAPVTFASVSRPSRPAHEQRVPVRTGSFSPGSGAAATLKRPPREVQTGGFGANDGIPGDPQKDSHTLVAHLGSFDLPSGSGQGNGTGGARGVRGTVASAGFGNAVGSPRGNTMPGSIHQGGFGTAEAGQPGGASRGSVRQGGFGSVVAGRAAPRTHAADPDAGFKPVEILSKPNPVYPAEARQLHLEGAVILSVDFEASGKLDILRVVKGLGHGMDEAAIRAAEKIRFKPAQRNGRPVSSKAMVHIIFQLAY